MYQLFFGFLELVFIGIYTYRKLPKEVFSLPIFSFYWSNVRGIIPFALSIAYTSSVWIFVSQVDKLVLSGVLNLKEYGYFSLAISLSGIIYAIGVPITQSITPRMISLYSVKDVSRLLKLYRYSTQIITLVALSVAIVISLFAKEIIFVWTGDIQAAEWSKDILFWYSLGNATLVISGVQYFLQVAYGQLRFHVLGGTLTLFIDVPIIILISLNFGAHSASIAWFLIRLFWLIVWTPIINFKFAPGLHAKWFFNDVLLIIVVVVLSALSLKSVFSIQSNNRHELIFHVFIFGFTLVIISSFSSSFVRLKFLSLIRTLLKLNLSKLNF
jgi:O-antigen/teichoic acid export membrane protein